MPTTTIPAQLTATLEQVRDRLVEQIGVRGLPTVWWSLSDLKTNDCLGFVLWGLGVRKRDDFWNPLVSIGAFRSVAGWHEVDAGEVRPGDLALWDWERDDDVDHIEFCYSIDRHAATITTISANTGPRVGDDIVAHPELRGVAKKTRPIDGRLRGGIRPPYRPPAATATAKDRTAVRLEASWLNRHVAHTFDGRTVRRTAAGTIVGVLPTGDGIRGPLFWILVQVWGRVHGLYGNAFRIDGIPGPQSRRVEAEVLRRAKLEKA